MLGDKHGEPYLKIAAFYVAISPFLWKKETRLDDHSNGKRRATNEKAKDGFFAKEII